MDEETAGRNAWRRTFTIASDRIITSIDGNKVTVDAPIMCAIETPWGGCDIIKYSAPERVMNVGIENLRGMSDFDQTADAAGFDLVTTFDAIHDQPKPLSLLKGIRRTLKPDGLYLAQDIHASSHHHHDREHPLGPLLYSVSIMHCMSVSLAQGGEGLGTMWGRERARDYFSRAGFGSIEVHQLPHDIQNDYWVLRP